MSTSDFATAAIEWGSAPDTITLLDLMKDTLGITDNAQDTKLSMYLNLSGNAAEKYIDNIIDQRSATEQLSRTLSPVALRYWPVSDLTLVEVDGEDKTTEYRQLFDDGIGWITKSSTTEGATSVVFSHVPGQMNITYTAGYAPLPTELGYAIMQGAISYRNADQSDGIAGPVKKESIVGVGSFEYETSTFTEKAFGLLPGSVTAVLEPYRRIGA